MIRILNNARFNVGSDALVIDGTLRQDDTATLSGNTISFLDKGILAGTGVWDNDMTFADTASLVLEADAKLNATWTFNGISHLNGNGYVLDISDGGMIVVAPGSTLYIDDLSLIGLGTGQIVLLDSTAKVCFANCSVRLNANVETLDGIIQVRAPTTFLVGSYNWTFAGSGLLSVDNATLWIDYLGEKDAPGTIYAPNALHEPNKWYINVAANLVPAGNLELLNQGMVKEFTDGSQTTNNPLVDGPLGGGTYYLTNNVEINYNQTIVIQGTPGNPTIIDGNGMSIDFANGAQLQVGAGCVLKLVNVTLLNLTQNTFNLGVGSKIIIGDGVVWELAEDITFLSKDSVIEVIDSSADQSGNVFKIQGKIFRKNFTLAPIPATESGSPYKILNLGHNTLELENAVFSGFDHIAYTTTVGSISAAIALSGNAGADIYSHYVTDPDYALYNGTGINFFVEDRMNDFFLRQDMLCLWGSVLFGDSPDNELSIRFNLDGDVPTGRTFDGEALVTENGLPITNPAVILSGDPGVFLSSDDGTAHILFPDSSQMTINASTNAFIGDVNGWLSYRYLHVWSNPILQYSTSFRSEGNGLSGAGISTAGLRGVKKSSHTVLTAIQIKRQKEKAALHPAAKPHAHKVKPSKIKPAKGKNRDIDEDIDEADAMIDRALATKKRKARSVQLPEVFDQQYAVQIFNVKDTPIEGAIKFDGTTVTNFNTNSQTTFNILLSNGTVVTQMLNEDGTGKDVTLVSDSQKINVQGKGNIIKVTGNMEIPANCLFMDKGAELTFEFVNNESMTPQLSISTATKLDLEENGVLRFKGDGIVSWGVGTEVAFKGIKTVTNGTSQVSSRPQFIVTDGATMTLGALAALRFSGVGQVEVSNNGRIEISQAGTLIIGVDDAKVDVNGKPTATENFNDFVITVLSNGEIDLYNMNSSGIGANGLARLSIRHTVSDISFNNALLFIDKNGVFEINADGTTLKPSILKGLSFKPGTIMIRDNGLFSLGVKNKTNKTLESFSYDGLLATFNRNNNESNPGFVRLIGGGDVKGFTARLHAAASANSRVAAQTADKLIMALSQQDSEWVTFTLFIDENGARKIRNKNGHTYKLEAGESVYDEDVTTGDVTIKDAKGKGFAFMADGTIRY
jgi:hypothetical protein